MKKRTVRRAKHISVRKAPSESYLIMVRSWMLVVVFALMLGMGAIMGHYLNLYLSGTAPTVAGAQIQQ